MSQEESFHVRSKRQQNWFWIDNEIIDVYGQRIGSAALAVYISIVRHSDPSKQTCFPSISLLQEHCRLRRPEVIEAIKVLEEHKLIGAERSPGIVTTYWVLDVPKVDVGTSSPVVLVTTNELVHQSNHTSSPVELVPVHQSYPKEDTVKEDTIRKIESEEDELDLQMPSFARWAEKIFREAGLKWVKPKYPDSFDKLDQVPARRDMLAYVKDGGTNFFEWYDRYKAQGDVWKPKPTNGNGKVYKAKKEQEDDEDPEVLKRLAVIAEIRREGEEQRQQRIQEIKKWRREKGYID